jgi:hypothetical protein
MTAPGRLRRALDITTIAVFVAGLFAVWLDFAARPMDERSAKRESRAPALPIGPITDLESLLTFPGRAERWWNDWFGLRDVLIGARNRLLWSGLGLSPSDQVVRGRDGWIFYQGVNEALQADRGARPLSPEALEAWQRVFETRRAWCEARGIQLLVAIVPSKARVYPELVPPRFDRLGPSRAEQVRERLGAAWDGVFVELDELIAHERELDTPGDPAYLRFGTHWTFRVAYRAYAAFVERLARTHPGLVPRPLGDFTLELDEQSDDSWAGRLYLETTLAESARILRLENPHTDSGPKPTMFVRDKRFVCAAAPLGKAYVLHDSFGPYVSEWLAEHFHETWTRWQYDFEPRTIEAFAPDVLVMLFSDRYFVQVEPCLSPEELADAAVAGRVAAAQRKTLFELDLDADRSRLHLDGKVVVERAADGLVVRTARSNDLVLLPTFACDGGPFSIELEIESPRETTLDVFFKTRTKRTFDRVRGAHARLQPGDNTLTLEVTAADALGELALRPGAEPDRYVLRRFVVRR